MGVYALSMAVFALSAMLLYFRVFRLILLGRPSSRFDQPLRRLKGAIPLILGQRKVLQEVSLRRDRAGLAHFFIFWGFLSFTTSYLLFIFGDSIWRELSSTLLTDTGVRIFASYLDILAVTFFAVLAWAALRRWLVRPHRLTFDLTQKKESAVILLLITSLMALTLLTEAFHTASGADDVHASALVGSALGGLFADAGVGPELAGGLQGLSWWLHLGVILGFSLFIPLSKHMHIVAAPISFLTRPLEPRGTLSTPLDLETADSFGAARVQDFTWKELLDGFACAVCGRCTDSCPANISGKILSPMHIVEDLKDHLLETGAETRKGEETPPVIGQRIQEEALWDCLTCGACVQQCPVGVEHVQTIVDMRRHLVMEEASMPESAMTALLSMEQRGHPWRGTTSSRLDWAQGLDVKDPGGAPAGRGALLGGLHRRPGGAQPERGPVHGVGAEARRSRLRRPGHRGDLHGRPGPPYGQRVPVPDPRPAEHRDPQQV